CTLKHRSGCLWEPHSPLRNLAGRCLAAFSVAVVPSTARSGEPPARAIRESRSFQESRLTNPMHDHLAHPPLRTGTCGGHLISRRGRLGPALQACAVPFECSPGLIHDPSRNLGLSSVGLV